ncbi:MAG: 3-deoxy-D-manno-octulosonic acid transferase, partial [Gammaproteobacteria bacterium]|nr:3-deoxy-D-manno-octulosonic acid transferase [Gammaproteobacteria bacterium]
MRLVYTFLLGLLFPIVLFYWFFKSPQWRRSLKFRFGFCSPAKNSLVLHAASVGETNAAQPLIEAILDRTEEALVISNFTVTGYERSAELFANRVVQTYLPFDLPWCVNIFLRRCQPNAIFIIETELWPNLLFACRKKNIPVYILSARLSDKSFSRYVKIKSLFKPAIQAVRKIGAQSELDQARF